MLVHFPIALLLLGVLCDLLHAYAHAPATPSDGPKPSAERLPERSSSGSEPRSASGSGPGAAREAAAGSELAAERLLGIDPLVLGILGLWCTTVGTVMLLPSIGSGLLAHTYQPAPDAVAASLINWHERVSYAVVLWFGALVAWRWDSRGQDSTPLPVGYRLAAVGGALLLVFGASLGGRLVYEHGMGVKVTESGDTTHPGIPAAP